jgi:hypothetical protein
MAKKGRSKKCTVDGIEFDSMSEACFYCWCVEAKELGVIESFTLQPHWELLDKVTYEKPTQLKTKVRYDTRVLLNGCSYTADFSILSRRELGLYSNTKIAGICDDMVALEYIDVKGERMHVGSSTNFSLIQKLMYMVHKIYVNKVVCGKFFAVNGMPRRLPAGCYMKIDSTRLYACWQKQFVECRYIDEVWKNR